MGDESPLHAYARFATGTTIFPKFTAYNISDNPWTSKPSPYNSHELETFKMEKDKTLVPKQVKKKGEALI